MLYLIRLPAECITLIDPRVTYLASHVLSIFCLLVAWIHLQLQRPGLREIERGKTAEFISSSIWMNQTPSRDKITLPIEASAAQTWAVIFLHSANTDPRAIQDIRLRPDRFVWFVVGRLMLKARFTISIPKTRSSKYGVSPL